MRMGDKKIRGQVFPLIPPPAPKRRDAFLIGCLQFMVESGDFESSRQKIPALSSSPTRSGMPGPDGVRRFLCICPYWKPVIPMLPHTPFFSKKVSDLQQALDYPF